MSTEQSSESRYVDIDTTLQLHAIKRVRYLNVEYKISRIMIYQLQLFTVVLVIVIE